MPKIKEGSRVVVYRTPIKSFADSMMDKARDLVGKMDTVISTHRGEEGDSVILASGWMVHNKYLKVTVS